MTGDLPGALALGGRITGDGTPVPCWSLTKTAIAAALMRLAESGALDLDAPLADQPLPARSRPVVSVDSGARCG